MGVDYHVWVSLQFSPYHSSYWLSTFLFICLSIYNQSLGNLHLLTFRLLLGNHLKCLVKQNNLCSSANFPKRSTKLETAMIACVVPGRHPQHRRVNVKTKSNSKPLAGSWLNISNVSTVHPKPPHPWAPASHSASSPQLHFQLGKKREPLFCIVSLELDLPGFSSEVCPFVWWSL